MKNLLAKTRTADKPYLVYRNDSGWEWRILKAWQADPHKPFARWFCQVTSPFTGSRGDLGDTYVHDAAGRGQTLTFRDPEVPDEAIPDQTKLAVAPDPWAGF